MAAITYPLGHKSKSTPAPSATEVLAQAQALGVVLALSDGELRARGNQAGIAKLAQHIRNCKPELVELLAPLTVAPDPAKPLPKFHAAQPWCALDREFQAHYWQCPACKAGGRTRGPLYPTGEQLQQAVANAMSKRR